jgi:hypothetical protein
MVGFQLARGFRGLNRVTRTIAGVVALVFIGCGDVHSPSQPTATSLPDRPPAQDSLSGFVQDTAFQPVADAHIEIVDGAQAGLSVVTDAHGRYVMPGSLSSAVLVRASKEGYVTVTKRHDPSGWSEERQTLGFTLDLSSPSVDLRGTYTLTLTGDSACPRFPSELRMRTYPASITLGRNSPDTHQYEAVLGGATFLASPLVGRFQINVAGTFGHFYLGDPYDWIDAIVEELAPSRYLAIWGFGGLPVGDFPIAGALRGGFEYCVSSTSPVVNGWYRCPAEPITCPLQRLQLVRR